MTYPESVTYGALKGGVVKRRNFVYQRIRLLSKGENVGNLMWLRNIVFDNTFEPCR